MSSPNAYERAADRFNTAAENWRQARIDAVRILQDARQEYDDAEENLRRHESKPGIPLPQYRHNLGSENEGDTP